MNKGKWGLLMASPEHYDMQGHTKIHGARILHPSIFLESAQTEAVMYSHGAFRAQVAQIL